MTKLTNAKLNKLTKQDLINRFITLDMAYDELSRQHTILVEENTELVNEGNVLERRLNFSKEREASLTESMASIVKDYEEATDRYVKDIAIERSIADKNELENGIMKIVTLAMFILTLFTLLVHVKL